MKAIRKGASAVPGFWSVVGLLALVAGGQIGSSWFYSEGSAETIGDSNGDLVVPDAYRTTYQLLGSWAVANEEGPGSAELHVVYASPGTIAAYRKQGRFPDGTVLVKEVYRAATDAMTTGTVSHADILRGWFVMVKAGTKHHPGSALWGDGWGWSWFDVADPVTPSRALPVKGGGLAASLDYRDNCKPCHTPAQGTDWIFVEGYPPLKQ